MRIVYKYKFDVSIRTEVDLPIGSEVLSVGFQENDIYFWANVNPDAQTEKRTFEVYATGQNIDVKPENLVYIGTAFNFDINEVYHVFERV